jgi:hypothetical protein
MPDDLRVKYAREIAVRYAFSFVGLPYRWGGDDPILGFDCSGFVIEVLTAVGLLPHGFDSTADGLLRRWREYEVVDGGGAGCVVLWLKGRKAIHTELMVDPFHTLGASGGGSSTTSDDAAASANAFIKLRPLGYRGRDFVILDPFAGGMV